MLLSAITFLVPITSGVKVFNWAATMYKFFFLQAEDGIRAFHVTGVQTCALPIYQVVHGGGPVAAGPELAHGGVEDLLGLELPGAGHGSDYTRTIVQEQTWLRGLRDSGRSGRIPGRTGRVHRA